MLDYRPTLTCVCFAAFVVSEITIDNGDTVAVQAGFPSTISFSYTSGTNVTAYAIIDDVFINGTISEMNRTGEVLILPEQLTNLSFGSYGLTLYLSKNMNPMETKDMVMFYEEPIVGVTIEAVPWGIEKVKFPVPTKFSPFPVTIKYPIQALVYLDTIVQISLTSGSNVHAEWIINSTSVFSKQCNGTIRGLSINATFDSVEVHNITVILKNTVSGPEVLQIAVHVLNPVEGFNVSILNKTALSTTDGPITFLIAWDISDRLPMGELQMELAYNSVKVLEFDLGAEMNELTNGSITTSYEQTVQGSYLVEVRIVSPVDIAVFKFNLSIWDNITFPSIKELARTGEDIFLMDYTLDSQKYEYEINYGNGHVDKSDPIILLNGRETSWAYNYTDFGSYTITITAWNPFYTYSSVKTILVMSPIPSLTIEPPLGNITYFPLLQDGARFIISMASDGPPPLNMYCLFNFGSGEVTSNISVSITPTEQHTITHTYTGSGEQDVIVVCTNPVSSITLNTKVYILPAIAGFELTGSNAIYVNNSETTTNVDFKYSAGEEMTASAILYADKAILLSVDFDSNAKKGTVIISSEVISNLTHGIYRASLELGSLSGEKQDKDIVIFYEASLDGFKVFQHDDLNLIQTETEFDIRFSSGHNPEIELLFEDIESVLEGDFGTITQSTIDHIFTIPLIYNVISVSRNSVSNRVLSNLTVEVIRSVAGFSAAMTNSLINSYSNMTLVIKLDNANRLPMGTVNLQIDYGDGSYQTISMNDKYNILLSSSGYVISHFYTKQGNKNVSMIFQAELTAQNIQLTANIWDDITSVKLSSNWAARVNELISFNLVNMLRSGFEYTITYGDGGQISNAMNVLYNDFSEDTKVHSYNMPDIYDVRLTVSNPFYSTSHQYKITIQYPIPALHITPQPPYMIPLPNGEIVFNVTMVSNNPSPTDVTCVYKYEDAHAGVNKSTSFVYGNTITKQYTYTNGGLKNVNVTCVNFVSTEILLTSIDVQPAVLDDYTFEYPQIVPVNMTSNSADLPVNVDFVVHLFQCVRFTPDVSFTWNFQDGSSLDTTIDKHHNHIFQGRSYHNITVLIQDNFSSVTKVLPIKIGAVDFSLNRYIGDVKNAVFTYRLSGIGVNGVYNLKVSQQETIKHIQTDPSDVFIHLHTFPYYIKEFRPNVIASNNNFTEILYFSDILKVDYNMSTLSITVTEKTYFPPGNVVVRVFLSDIQSIPLPFVACSFDMGDYIDYRTYYKTQNITYNDPLVFNYQYKVLGNLTAKVKCINNYDQFSTTTIVESYNDCFTVNGIFDRQYSNMSHPMKVYTSIDFDLASRMAVYCINIQIEFDWTIYTFDANNDTHVYDYTPVASPRGTFRFARGSIPENLYRVGLNVSLLGKTWIWEPTHIQFVKPPPTAFIEGGNERYAKIWKQYIILDAFTSSYDVSMGYGANRNLEFEWTCELIQADNLNQLSINYKSGTNRNGDCTHLLSTQSTGVSSLTLLADDRQGYAVTVKVTLQNTSHPLSDTFLQLIMGTQSEAPDVVIECQFNCNPKYSVMSKSIWKAVCLDCEDNSTTILEYKWGLSRLNPSTGTFIAINLIDITDTGINKEMLVILNGTLMESTEYELIVSVNQVGEQDVEEAKANFKTKRPPYGGHCTASNHSATGRAAELFAKTYDIPSGIASTTMFAIHCHNWKDDKDGDSQDKDNPLIYEYVLVKNHTDEDGNIVLERISLYQGGESSASELRLPVGEAQYNFIINVYVRILERFGDFTTVHLQVQVFPNEDLTLKGEDDDETTTALLNYFDDNFDMTDAGGNNMAVFRMMTSMVAFYNKIEFQNSTASADTSSLDGIVSYDEESQSDVQNTLQERTTDFLAKISSKIPENSSLVILPSDTRLAASTIIACISNKDVMSENASAEVSNTVYNLIQNVQKVANMKPFPMTEFENIRGSTEDVIDIISKNVNYLSTASRENLNKTLTREMVDDDLQEYYRYHPEGIAGYPTITNELILVTFIQRQKIRMKQAMAENSTRVSVDKLMGALELAVNITSATTAFGEGEKVIKKKHMNISIEKDSVNSFLNRSEIKRDGFIIDTTNSTLENITAKQMELQVNVFSTSPILHAGGHSKISGKVIGISLRDENKNTIEIPLQMRIQNEGVAFVSEYTLSSNGPMEFISYLQDSNDAVLVYLSPVGFDESNIDDYNYTVYVNSKISPTVNDYAFKTEITAQDWTSFGFKVFCPSGSFEEGNIIIALNVLEESNDKPSPNVRKRRSTDVVNNTDTETALTNLTITIVTTGCRVFNTKAQSWNPNGCSVLPFSTLNETVCRCSPGSGTLFTSSFFTPNLIDFHNVFSKFDASNAAVYGTMIGVLVLYLVGVIYLRRKDKTDEVKWTPFLLCDNNADYEYFYMITVHTGLRPGAGTTSNVCFVVSGEKQDTGVRILSNGHTKEFVTGSVCTYIMGTKSCLGDLLYVRIWHDNSGEGAGSSWYLHKIIIRDLQNKDCFIFLCDSWFALDIGDGMIDRLITAVSKNDIELDTLVSHHARLNVTENHLWLSMLLRPQKSPFTRVQRLSCVLALLFLAMITNAMFFQSQDESTVTADTVRIGAFSLSLRTVYISIVGAVITIIPLSIVTFIFRNSKVQIKKKQHGPTEETIEEQALNIKLVDTGKFPHWATYIAWAIIVLAVLCSAFFLLLYSMQWGTEVSNEWLLTFVLSFFESIFVVDPFKVLLFAILIAVLTRRPVEADEVVVDLDSVKRSSALQSKRIKNDQKFEELRLAVMSVREPLPEDALKRKRKQLHKEKVAKKAFIRLMLQVLLAVLVFTISYMSRDERAFLLKANIENHLYVSSKYHYGFSKVTSQEGFIKWIKETLVPLYFPTSSYNGGSISVRDKFLIGDMNNVRLGLIRLRQLRVKKEPCYGPSELHGHFCGRKYDSDSENKETFCDGCTIIWTPDSWQYTPAKDVWGIDIVGKYNTYKGGGFIINLENEVARMVKQIDESVSNRWINRLTRAVLVEFTLYNPNINMIAYSIFMVEFLEVGGSVTWFDTQCFRPTRVTDATGVFSIICYVFYIIAILSITVKWVQAIIKDRCHALKQFWNIVDLVLLTFSYTAIVIWVCKYIITKRALQTYYEDMDKFVNFQHIVIWEYVYTAILGMLCFICTVRLLRILGYNRRLTEIATVLKVGGVEIMKFFIVFFHCFFAFVLFGYLLFGHVVHEWRNVFISFGSLTNTLIGRNSLDKLIGAAPNFAELYFFVYVFVMIFTLMTMFLAVLNKAIEDVRHGHTSKEDPIGITDIIKGTANDFLQLFGIHLNRRERQPTTKKYAKNTKSSKVNTSNVMRLVRETFGEMFAESKAKRKDKHAMRRDKRHKRQGERSREKSFESVIVSEQHEMSRKDSIELIADDVCVYDLTRPRSSSGNVGNLRRTDSVRADTILFTDFLIGASSPIGASMQISEENEQDDNSLYERIKTQL